MNTKSDVDRLKLLYEENATQFRFFLTWRQLLLAGYFAVLAALALGFEWAFTSAPDLTFACPLAGAFVSILFWALDYRNRELYRHASGVGAALEAAMGRKGLGYYGTYAQIENSKLRHSIILNTFYLTCGAAMFIIALVAILLRFFSMALGG